MTVPSERLTRTRDPSGSWRTYDAIRAESASASARTTPFERCAATVAQPVVGVATLRLTTIARSFRVMTTPISKVHSDAEADGGFFNALSKHDSEVASNETSLREIPLESRADKGAHVRVRHIRMAKRPLQQRRDSGCRVVDIHLSIEAANALPVRVDAGGHVRMEPGVLAKLVLPAG